MAEVECRFTGVLTPAGDHRVIMHTAGVGLDDMDLEAVDDLYARVREHVPSLGPLVLSGRHYGRALNPAGDAQLYVVTDEPLSHEQRAVLDRFAETGEWPWPRSGETDS